MMMREKITHPEWEVAGARSVSSRVQFSGQIQCTILQTVA